MILVAPTSLVGILGDAIELLIALIIIDAILSNIIAFGGRISPRHPLVRSIRTLVTPVLAPIRRALPPHKTGNWDLSPFIAIVVLQWLRIWLG